MEVNYFFFIMSRVVISISKKNTVFIGPTHINFDAAFGSVMSYKVHIPFLGGHHLYW